MTAHRGRRLQTENFTNPERCPFGNSDVGGHDLLQPSIKSIDVRAATYQDANRFTYRLKDYVNRLSKYEGGNLQNVQVDLSQVTERVLELIVPKGSLTVMQRAVIKAANIRAQTAGSYPVRIIVKDFWVSLMLFHAYLRNGIVYVPTVVRLQIGGAYWDVEPVAVEPIADTEGLRRAFFDAIARKNAFVPNPPKNRWPRPILLKYSGAKTWSVFARNASLWSIDEENGVYSIAGYKEHPDGYLVRDKSRKTDFPPARLRMQ